MRLTVVKRAVKFKFGAPAPWRYLERAPRDFSVQSDGGPQSAGQTENSFRQSQTILRDL